MPEVMPEGTAGRARVVSLLAMDVTPLLAELNPAQREAVAAGPGPLPAGRRRRFSAWIRAWPSIAA